MEIVSNQISICPIEDTFTLKLNLPLKLVSNNGGGSDIDMETVNKLNNNLLDIVLASSDPVYEGDEIDELLINQLRLTEAKVDLVLTWLSRLVAVETAVPKCMPIELSTTGIRFVSNEIFDLNDSIQIQLYVDPRLAEPIKLQSQLVSIRETAITAKFIDMDLDVNDKLGRYIFREHRRNVACEKKIRSGKASSHDVNTK